MCRAYKSASFVLLLTLVLGACTSSNRYDATRNFVAPGGDRIGEQLDSVFACMKSSGALHNQGFAIGPFSNDTGKLNQVSDGATGSFLPSGPNISIYAIEAVSRAGGIAYDYSNLELVRNIAFTGGEAAAKHMHALQNANMPKYGINVFATALDFNGVSGTDLRIDGVGPIAQNSSAHAYYAAHIVQPGSQRSLARGYAIYEAQYFDMGLGINRFLGGGDGTLVTGVASIANQQPLQRPAAEGIMVAVAYALMDIPALAECRAELLPFDDQLAENDRNPEPFSPGQGTTDVVIPKDTTPETSNHIQE